MPLTYVSNGPWGAGQGSPLNAEQHDTNVYTLAQGIEALETAFAAAITLQSPYITSSGNIVTFHLSNGSTIPIVFELPGFNFRGAWLNSTAYAVGDIVTVASLGVYLVLIPHTTPASPEIFDPEATEEGTDGDPLYGLLIPVQDLTRLMKWRGAFPAEDTIDQYDVFVDEIFGAFITNSAHVGDTTIDPDALDEDDNPLYEQIAGPPFSSVEEITDAAYEVTRLDRGKYLRFTNVAGCAITFASDIPVNAEIHLRQAAEGSLTFSETTDVIINPQREGFDTTSPYEGAVIAAKVVAAGVIDLIGPHGAEITA